MGEGVGSCSSWETKYRWRKVERICPRCGKANIRKSQHEEGWYCWTKTEGCGARFAAGDTTIESQEAGRKPNPDMADVVNTVLKMAYKRSKVSTAINCHIGFRVLHSRCGRGGLLGAESRPRLPDRNR